MPTRPILMIGAFILYSSVAALGQVNNNDADALRPTESTRPPVVAEQSPRVLYALDAHGNQVPLINVTWERIRSLLNGPGPMGPREPPRFQIDHVRITGRAEQQRATLELEVDCTTLVTGDEEETRWVGIPLKMHEGSLVEPPKYDGAGQMFLSFDEADGYRAWIRHKTSGPHKIHLRFWKGLSRAALATQLHFSPPLANVSQLRLDVPGGTVKANIENGRELQVASSGNARSVLTATDLRNQVVVVWRDGDEAVEQQTAFLDVTGDIRVLIDGPGAIRSDVTLDIKSNSGDIQTFALRLPPHTTIVSSSDQNFQISELDQASRKSEDNRRTVQVTALNPDPQLTLQLTTQTAVPTDDGGTANGSEPTINVANFEVLSALRQSGRVSLLASEDWLVYWYLGSSVRRVPGPEDPGETLERKRLATFEYFRQPCRLDVEVKPQSTRVNVEPTFQLEVREDRVSLEATLRYKIRGARVSFLDFSLNGWQLDDVGPSTTVENDHFQDDSSPNIKLRLTQPRTGEVELVLNLHRPVTEPSGTLRFPLPWPSSDRVTPGMLVVTPAAAIELNYRLQEMVGLAQDTLPAELSVNVRPTGGGQPPAAFRFRHDRAPGDVVIDYQVRDQEVTVRANAVIDVSPETTQVTQQFDYRVLYEPAQRLRIDLPRPLFEFLSNPRNRVGVQLEVEGRPADFTALIDAVGVVDEDQPSIPLSFPLDQPRLGSFNVQLSFRWPVRTSSVGITTTVPLATPRDGSLVDNTAKINSTGRMRIEINSDDRIWVRDDEGMSSDSTSQLAVMSGERPSKIRLRATTLPDDEVEETATGATVVHRAWFRTWLSGDARLDRAAFQISAGADRVYLKVPDADLQNSVVLVDGRKVATALDQGDLAIDIPTSAPRDHTIEIAVKHATRPTPGKMQFPLPEFRDAQPPRRWFWQLLLPEDEHLLTADERLTSDNRWVRDGWFWRRRGSMTQPTLEAWTGALVQAPVPTQMNKYLFSSFDRVQQVSVRTCPRRFLVYSSSLAVLVGGLALIYVPVLRHPVSVLLLACSLLCGVWLFPSTTVLLAQASLLGSILIVISLLVSCGMRWISTRRGFARIRQGDPPSGAQVSWRDLQTTTVSTAQDAPVSLLTQDSKA